MPTAAHVASWGRRWPRAGASPAGGTSGLMTLLYDDTAGRIAVTVSSPPSGAATIYLQRSTDQVTWTDVRGAQSLLSAPTISFYDYEYTSGVVNYYRATYYNGSGGTIPSATVNSVTPNQTKVWLKNPLRPFLNQTVSVVGIGDITRNSRSGTFDVIGRTLQVAVTDLMSGRSTTLSLRTTNPADITDLDLMVAVGEVLFIQPPYQSAVPTMYAVPGNVAQQRVAMTSAVRIFPLPLTEVATPDLTLAAVQSTYQTVVSTYATYAALLAAKVDYNAVLQIVGSASDVITS